MAPAKKSPSVPVNLRIKKRIKHPAIALALELGFTGISAMVEKMLEVQLIKHGKIEPVIEPTIDAIPEEELRPAQSTNRKATAS